MIIGCTNTQEPQWIPASADIEENKKPIDAAIDKTEKKEQAPVNIDPNATEKPKPPIKEEKDIVKESYERHLKQREMDQKANQEWWDSVQKHKKEMLELRQQYAQEYNN